MLGIPWANLNKLTLQHHVATWKTQRRCKIVACLLQFQQGSTKKTLSHSRLPWLSWMQTAAAATSRRTRCFSENAILQTQADVWAKDWSKFLERERKLHKSLWGEKWKSPGAASPFIETSVWVFPHSVNFPAELLWNFHSPPEISWHVHCSERKEGECLENESKTQTHEFLVIEWLRHTKWQKFLYQ